jgi:hypothetical protein
MSTINTILIKRRLASSPLNSVPSLTGGELAFSEKNNTLYYGSEAGTLEIGGSGAYLTRNTAQTASGNKTFTGSTTLSSTTFSSNSLIDAGNNKITNLAEPSATTDATTRNYVDNAISNLASNGGTAVTSLSTEVYNTFIKLTDDRAVNLTGGLTVNTVNATGNASVGGNLTVTGDLSVLGATTTLETTTTLTSAFAVTNAGSGPALVVTQTGSNDIATFYDDASTALIIKDGGNVGVGTATPNAKLTVAGSLSASGAINGASTLDIAGATTLASTLNVTGASTLNSTLAVANAATFASTVSSAGALTVNGTSTLNGAVTVNNTLNTTGATTLGSTLNVTGAATFASTLSASGNADIDGTLTVDGLTTINNNLVVTGTTSIDAGKITTNGSGRITGTAGVSELINFIIDGGSF